MKAVTSTEWCTAQNHAVGVLYNRYLACGVSSFWRTTTVIVSLITCSTQRHLDARHHGVDLSVVVVVMEMLALGSDV